MRRERAGDLGDRGAATLELIALSLLVLVPILYLITALARIQAATYAAEAGAYAGARAAVVAGLDAAGAGLTSNLSSAAAHRAAAATLAITVEDFGIDAGASRVVLDCGDGCLAPGGRVGATVSIDVALPGIPEAVVARLPLMVTVSAAASSPVDGYLP